MKNWNEKHRELAKKCAWNLFFSYIGLGAGLGVYAIMQVLWPLHGNPLAVSIIVGGAMAVFLSALKRMAFESLPPSSRANNADRSRGGE